MRWIQPYCHTHTRTDKRDPNRYYYSSSECIWEQWQWRSTLHSPELHYWILLTGYSLMFQIPHFWGGGPYTLCRVCSRQILGTINKVTVLWFYLIQILSPYTNKAIYFTKRESKLILSFSKSFANALNWVQMPALLCSSWC